MDIFRIFIVNVHIPATVWCSIASEHPPKSHRRDTFLHLTPLPASIAADVNTCKSDDVFERVCYRQFPDLNKWIRHLCNDCRQPIRAVSMTTITAFIAFDHTLKSLPGDITENGDVHENHQVQPAAANLITSDHLFTTNEQRTIVFSVRYVEWWRLSAAMHLMSKAVLVLRMFNVLLRFVVVRKWEWVDWVEWIFAG